MTEERKGDDGSDMSSFKILSTLGKGTYGEALLVKMGSASKHHKHVSVIKVSNRHNLEESLFEFLMLKGLSHPNILKTKSIFTYNSAYVIELERMDSIFTYDCTLAEFKDKIKQVIQGLRYMHIRGFIHNDLKPANILERKGVVKLADFGLVRYNGFSQNLDTGCMGTPLYVAPECDSHDHDESKEQQERSYASDVWSIGIMMSEFVYRTLIGRFPGEGVPLSAVEIVEHIGLDGFKLMKMCLRRDPAERPTTTEILAHHFFIDDDDLTPFSLDQHGGGRIRIGIKPLRRNILHKYNSNVTVISLKMRREMIDNQTYNIVNKGVINRTICAIIADWGTLVSVTMNISNETCMLAGLMFSVCTSRKNYEKSELKGLMCMCHYLAYMLYNDDSIDISAYVYLTYREYSQEQMHKFIDDILKFVDASVDFSVAPRLNHSTLYLLDIVNGKWSEMHDYILHHMGIVGSYLAFCSTKPINQTEELTKIVVATTIRRLNLDVRTYWTFEDDHEDYIVTDKLLNRMTLLKELKTKYDELTPSRQSLDEWISGFEDVA